ncbi:DgyrCDS8828 [Dimorphilus gyrociliatus]|uniref:DgyrCDS8828 n=1 Tax=Dimorphilus gyrociliatus TaxID=2664684 RepID=A0A7I8VWT3_9ANNE|nr:DgyrCDS8828 [Dimorphilus gyrociliatus]
MIFRLSILVFCVVLFNLSQGAKLEKKPEVASEKCLVSDWKEWNECKSKSGSSLNKRLTTIHLKPAQYDSAREWMKLSMAEKEEYIKYLEKCRADASCPMLNLKPSKGRVDCVNGMAGEYPCKLIDQLSFVNLRDLGSTDPRMEGNDIWGWTDPQTNDEYAIVGVTDGTSFVRVTNPEEPKVLGFLPTRTTRSDWRDMKVVNNHAYIVSEAPDHGLQVYDLTQLRGKETFTVLEPTAIYSEFGNAHNIVANEESNTVFVVGQNKGNYPNLCAAGLHMIDVSKPAEPKFLGCFSEDGYVHDAQCLFYHGPDAEYRGKEICFCYNEDTLTIVDVTSKTDAKLISKVSYTGYRYTHQGWLLEDHSALLMDDEQDESNGSGDGRTITYFWDVKSLKNPVLMNTYISSERAIDHNQYILGNYTYQSNYEAGLRILEINKPDWTLEEVAYFDVMPKEIGEVKFQGSWSNYPYFKSRNVIVNSIEFGLFVVRPRYDDLPKSKETGEQIRTRNILDASHAKFCPHLLESRECKP